MKPSFFCMMIRLCLGVAAAGCVVPGTVFGSCGDYLHTKHSRPMSDPHRSASDLSAARPERMSDGWSEPADSSLVLPSEQPAQLPCSGPECRRQRPSDQPNVPAFPPTPTSGDALSTPASGPYETDADGALVRHQDSAPRDGYPRRMERPPEISR